MRLLDLPDEILVIILAASGCTTICSAARTCRPLRKIKTMLGKYPVFSSAMSRNVVLDEAVADVCKRALTGMLGAVDFALVFESRVSPTTAAPSVIQLLRRKLPQGVVILGSSSAGLMGIDSCGSPFDLDPDFKEADGVGHVALLLGRVPGSSIRTFATDQQPQEDAFRWEEPREPGPMDGLLTLAQEGLQAQMVMLLANKKQGLSGSRGLLAKLQPPNQGNGGMVMAGGIASGNGHLFFSSPEQVLAEPCVVALAICKPCQPVAELPAPLPPPALPQVVRTPTTVAELPAPLPPPALPQVVRTPKTVAELPAPLPPPALPQVGISAAALTLQGLEPVGQTPWSDFTVEPDGDVHVVLTGEDIDAMWSGTGFDAHLLAIWQERDRGLSCLEAAAGGQPVVLLEEHTFQTTSHEMSADIDAFERHSLEQLLASQPETSLLAQPLTFSSEGMQRSMRLELPKMRDFVTASVMPSRPIAGSPSRTAEAAWEPYEAVRRTAQVSGARSGSSALVLFGCTELDQDVRGATGVELSLLDQVVGGELPLVGMYCNEELGPYLRGGYAGWSVASSSQSPVVQEASAFKPSTSVFLALNAR